MSRVFTVIGFWGPLDEREVIGVIEGIHQVYGGAAAENYADGGPFAMSVYAVDPEDAEVQVQGTTEEDDIVEATATDGRPSVADRIRTILYDPAQPESDALSQIREVIDHG